MRIWYQSLGRLGAWGGYPAALRALLERARDPGTVLHVAGTTRGIAEHYYVLSNAVRAEVLANLRTALADGYDAFVIGNFFDVGLRECREMARIPVIGLGETSCHVAMMMGRSFGLVAPNEKYAAHLAVNLRALGLDSGHAGTAVLDIRPITRMADAFTDDAALTAFVAEAEAAVEREIPRAEVVVPAGGVVMALLDKAGYRGTPRHAPVLNGIACALQFAEMAVRLGALQGGFVSKRLSYAPPPAEEMPRIRALYGPDIHPGAGE
jgi:Asp/Glu/hydantoin racemase